MKNIGISVVIAKIMSCVTSHLRAIINLLNLSFMLIFYVHMMYVLSRLFFLDDLEELHEYMLIWSFKFCWNYALMLSKYYGIISKNLLKLYLLRHYFQ